MKQRSENGKTILFDVATLSQMTLVQEMGRRASKKDIKVVIWFSGTDKATKSKVLEESSENRWVMIDQAQFEDQYARSYESVARSAISTAWGVVKQRIQHNGQFRKDPKVNIFLREFREKKQAAAKVMEAVNPNVVVVCEDGISGNSCLIDAAKKKGIPVVVCPYEFSGREDFDNYVEENRKGGSLITLQDRPIDRAVEQSYSHWVRQTPYGKVVIFPAEYIMARELEGLTLPYPWTTNGGNADYIAVESVAMMRHYMNEGLPESKLELLGSSYCDVLCDTLQEDVGCSKAYEAGKKIRVGRTSFLISLPPSYHSSRGSSSEFSSYREMCKMFAQAFSEQSGVTRTFVVHPATLPEDRRCLEELGLPISNEWVIRLIPRHDVYVTSFSSTIRWAIACGKPVINYDAYQFNLKVYSAVTSVITTGSFNDVVDWMSVLKHDCQYDSIAKRAAEYKDEWGVIDGKNSDRIFNRLLICIAQSEERQGVA